MMLLSKHSRREDGDEWKGGTKRGIVSSSVVALCPGSASLVNSGGAAAGGPEVRELHRRPFLPGSQAAEGQRRGEKREAVALGGSAGAREHEWTASRQAAAATCNFEILDLDNSTQHRQHTGLVKSAVLDRRGSSRLHFEAKLFSACPQTCREAAVVVVAAAGEGASPPYPSATSPTAMSCPPSKASRQSTSILTCLTSPSQHHLARRREGLLSCSWTTWMP